MPFLAVRVLVSISRYAQIMAASAAFYAACNLALFLVLCFVVACDARKAPRSRSASKDELINLEDLKG